MKSFVELWRLKEPYKTFRENIELNKKQGKLCGVLLFRRKIVFVFCLLILEKP